MHIRVRDPADPRLEHYRNLRDVESRRRHEQAAGVFVVEGERALRTVLDTGWGVESVLVLDTKLDRLEGLFGSSGAAVYVAGRDVLAAVAGFPVHRGVLAIARRPAPAEARSLAAGTALALVVEGVNDHENLGSLFRNAAAFGVGAVLMDPSTCDPLYRRSVRVSVGNVLRVPFARLDPWPGALGDLSGEGFTIAALTPQGDVALDEAAGLLAGAPGRVAVLVGSEGEGISEAALERATIRVRIPMAAGVDSLNVSTAAAVALSRLGPPARGAVGVPPLV